MCLSDLEFYLKIIEYFFRSNLNKLYIIFSTFLFSPKLFFLEIRRRLFGKSYEFKKFNITSCKDFDFLYQFFVLKKNERYEIQKYKNGYILHDRKTNLRIFSETFLDFLLLLEEESLDLYEFKLKKEKIKNKKVLDVGGYIDTPIAFAKMGAKKVVTYEPIHYRLLLKNLKLNKIKNVIVNPYYVYSSECEGIKEWLKDRKLKKTKRKIVSWKEVLKEKFDIAKVDCEGCEEGLLYVNNKLLQKVLVWIIEIHGSGLRKKIIEKFKDAGFKEKLIFIHNLENYIYRFERD